MSDGLHYDALEVRDPADRERDLFRRLPAVIKCAARSPLYCGRLDHIEAASVRDRVSLAMLPILRKSDLPSLQQAHPPFGGNLLGSLATFGRFFASPGPIFEPERNAPDPWGGARALHAAGFRAGDVVLNTFSYHLTPGGFVMDGSARSLQCIVIPAGPASKEQQLDVIAAISPTAYCGTPDFLKILRDASEQRQKGGFSIRKAVVSGAAFPVTLQTEFRDAGIDVFQVYATAEFGIIGYETSARDGLTITEDLIIEIVRPGTAIPVTGDEVGELVATSLNPDFPLLRVALGDLSAFATTPSASGHTNHRIRGWMGRADQTAKIKGMFVRPEQLAKLTERHRVLGKVRLVVTRRAETDTMSLIAETSDPARSGLADDVAATLHELTRLHGEVQLVAPGTLPNDGKVISDERPL